MSLIGPVGRKRPRARLAMATLYLVLCLGALTTLYPFAVMVSTGLKGPTDQTDNALVPKYFLNDGELLHKYVDDKYAGDQFNIAANRLSARGSPPEIEAYDRFLRQLDPDYWEAAFRNEPNEVTGRLTIRYHQWLRSRYRSINALNVAYIEENIGFQTVQAPPELFDLVDWEPNPGQKWAEWIEFKRTLPPEFRAPVRTQWLWQKYMAGVYKNQFGSVPPVFAGSAKTFTDMVLPDFSGPPAVFGRFAGIGEGFRSKVKTRFLSHSVESQWAEYFGKGVPMPIAAADAAFLKIHAGEVRKEFAGRNYGYVLDYVLLNGNAVWNTVVFCLLAILTQLTVNPLAAYALSRYPVKQSGKILIFLLATMAFPAEVAMIPSFLLLKDLGLLNTFAALVLPTAASGYMIFLLKGFFDSLPQELFEAGSLDGAPEITMMTRIALPMSKPVLGYLALLAFMGAYGAFIYAFLVAQDQRIWTLMVWIYQLQNSGAPSAVIMAALTLAAVPTLVVFLCAQSVIMRGIVLPGER